MTATSNASGIASSRAWTAHQVSRDITPALSRDLNRFFGVPSKDPVSDTRSACRVLNRFSGAAPVDLGPSLTGRRRARSIEEFLTQVKAFRPRRSSVRNSGACTKLVREFVRRTT